ncbi:MAG: STAS domain-containing protein [Vulcanimicrobiaceae bacterium]
MFECSLALRVLHVKGDVDSSNSSVLEAAIAGAARRHRGLILVSFSDCDFADSSCAQVLIRQFVLLSARLAIVAPPATRFRRLLDVAGLRDALPVYNSVAEVQLAIACGPATLVEIGTRERTVDRRDVLHARRCQRCPRASRRTGILVRRRQRRHEPSNARALLRRGLGRTQRSRQAARRDRRSRCRRRGRHDRQRVAARGHVRRHGHTRHSGGRVRRRSVGRRGSRGSRRNVRRATAAPTILAWD